MKRSPKDISLVPFGELKKSVRTILGTTKAESDKQMAAIHDINVKRRAAKKKR